MKYSLFYFSRAAAAVSQDASLSKVLTERSTTRVPLWISETDIGGYDLFDLQFKIRQTCSWKCALPKIFLGIIVLILWNRSENECRRKKTLLKEGKLSEESDSIRMKPCVEGFSLQRHFLWARGKGFYTYDVKVTNSISSDTHSAALCCVWLKFKDLKQSNGNVEEHVT